MRTVFFIFFLLAVAGWIGSCVAHALAYNGYVFDYALPVLLVGFLLTWIAFLFRLKVDHPGMRRIPIGTIFQHAPLAIRTLAIAGFLYSAISAFYLSFSGKRVFTDITDPDAVYLFSLACIGFYGVATAGLFPSANRKSEFD